MADSNGSERPDTLGVHDLTLRIEEAQEILRAIRSGEVDALSIRSGDSEQVYTLHGSDRIYRVFIEEMNESAVILDRDGMILYGNARLAEALGTFREALVGDCLRRFIAEQDQPSFDRLLEPIDGNDGEPRRKRELMLVAADGTLRRIVLSLSRVAMDPGGYYYAAILTDVTDLREAQEALARVNDELERRVAERTRELELSNGELEEFAYVASHDLRAPLRAVAGLAEWIDEDSAGALDEENRERLRLMRERVKRMDQLIEEMLAYARLGRTGSAREPVDLSGLLRELVAGLALPAGFQVQLEEPLPCLTGPPLHLHQIFQNLINNAVQHHDRPQGHLRVRAADGGSCWRLELADDGPGIPAANRERVFKMFATGGSAGHAGIGLAVVRKLVVANGGRIEIGDNQPRGAVFRIFWPK